MLKKFMLLSTCLFANYLSAYEDQPCETRSQIGKYQMVCNDLELYLLDTETGTVWQNKKDEWLSDNYSGWRQIKSPFQMK